MAGRLCIYLAGGWEAMHFPGGWLEGYVSPSNHIKLGGN